MQALSRRRPRFALENLERIQPVGGWVGQWSAYWTVTLRALHWVGAYDKELDVAGRARDLSPEGDVDDYALAEIRALAGLGRFSDIGRRLQTMSESRSIRSVPGVSLYRAANELRTHGRPIEAGQAYDLALEWFRSSAAAAWARADGTQREESRLATVATHAAVTLIHAGYYEEALPVFRARLATLDNQDNVAMLGIAAARTGNRAEAERMITRLEAMAAERPQHPSPLFYLVAVHSAMDDLEQATAYLARLEPFALNETWVNLHTWPVFEPLRQYPPARKLMEALQ